MKIEGTGNVRLHVLLPLVAYGLILLGAIKYASKEHLVWYMLPFLIVLSYLVVNRIKGRGKAGLYEKAWIVQSEDTEIVSIDYHKKKTSVEFSQICKVTIQTNDSGPWGTDVWWIIEDDKATVRVPGGATGEREMINRLQTIEGFDSGEIIKAMGCTSNMQFIAYQKNK